MMLRTWLAARGAAVCAERAPAARVEPKNVRRFMRPIVSGWYRGNVKPTFVAAMLLGMLLPGIGGSQNQPPQRKRVLIWADTLTAYQHDSISHACAVLERLGRESGAYDAYI